MRQQGVQQALHHRRRKVMAHAGDGDEARARDAPCGVFAAGEGTRGSSVPAAPAWAPRCDRVPATAWCRPPPPPAGGRCPRPVAAPPHRREDAPPQFLLRAGIGRAADGLEQAHVMRQQDRFAVVARPAQHHLQHVRARSGQVARAARTHDAGERQHPPRRAGQPALRDHPAHAGAHYVGLGIPRASSTPSASAARSCSV